MLCVFVCVCVFCLEKLWTSAEGPRKRWDFSSQGISMAKDYALIITVYVHDIDENLRGLEMQMRDQKVRLVEERGRSLWRGKSVMPVEQFYKHVLSAFWCKAWCRDWVINKTAVDSPELKPPKEREMTGRGCGEKLQKEHPQHHLGAPPRKRPALWGNWPWRLALKGRSAFSMERRTE